MGSGSSHWTDLLAKRQPSTTSRPSCGRGARHNRLGGLILQAVGSGGVRLDRNLLLAYCCLCASCPASNSSSLAVALHISPSLDKLFWDISKQSSKREREDLLARAPVCANGLNCEIGLLFSKLRPSAYERSTRGQVTWSAAQRPTERAQQVGGAQSARLERHLAPRGSPGWSGEHGRAPASATKSVHL